MLPTGRVDVHTHLLPGVDDGCATVEESITCARALVTAGYTHAYCTPHVWPDLPGNNAREIKGRVADLQGAFDDAGVALKLLPGGELNLMSAWPRLGEQARGEVVTYGLLGRYAPGALPWRAGPLSDMVVTAQYDPHRRQRRWIETR